MNRDTVTIHLNTGGIINSEAVVYGRIILRTDGSLDACTLNVELIVSEAGILLREIDTVSTGVVSLAVANNGQFGVGGDAGQSCVRMNYFCTGDCDTVDSIPGNTKLYMYDGSIVVGGIVNGDTILSNQIYSQGFNQESSIYPLTPTVGPITQGILQYWRSGILTNHDTTIGMEISYYAPQVTQTWGTAAGKTWHADQQFITREFKVWSMDGLLHEGLTVGEVVDWDIPSDSGVKNTGVFDASRNLLYCIGGEYNQDNLVECQDNNERYGGMAYGYFKRFNSSGMKWSMAGTVPYGSYHESNSRYVYHGWKVGQLYANMQSKTGLNPWSHTNLDSQLIDLHSVMTYLFDYDLLPDDTLAFYSVLATVRNESEESPLPSILRVQELAERGRNFVTYFGCCRGLRGDLNGDGRECNILDLTYQVDYIFRGGMKPTCLGEADINADGSPGDILDLTFMVNRIFRGGIFPFTCGEPPCNTPGCH